MTNNTVRVLCAGLCVIVLVSLGTGPAANEQKLTAQELIDRHLVAIGTAEARAAAAHRVTQGSVNVRINRGDGGNLVGPFALASEGRKFYLHMEFEDTNYPRERFSFDGQKPNIPRVVAEGYTRLGQFLRSYDHLIREGLVGGALSTSWAMLDVPGRHPKLDYAGLKTMQGKELHRLEYRAQRGVGDLVIRLYFDPESYLHVMSTYVFMSRSGQRTSGDLRAGGVSATEAFRREELTERFSEFETIDDLTLPVRWYISYILEENTGSTTGSRTLSYEWTIQIQSIDHDSAIDSSVFASGS